MTVFTLMISPRSSLNDEFIQFIVVKYRHPPHWAYPSVANFAALFTTLFRAVGHGGIRLDDVLRVAPGRVAGAVGGAGWVAWEPNSHVRAEQVAFLADCEKRKKII